MKRILAVMLAFAVFATVAPTPAHAGARDHEPATRSYVAYVIVERALLADVPNRDRDDLWQGSECFGDRDFTVLSFRQRRRICLLQAHGYMHGYNDYEFGARDQLRRDQMASLIMRLATQEGVEYPQHAAVFFDVDRNSVHEQAIRFGVEHRLIFGYDTTPATFGPERPVTRKQARELVDRVVDHWRHGAAR